MGSSLPSEDLDVSGASAEAGVACCPDSNRFRLLDELCLGPEDGHPSWMSLANIIGLQRWPPLGRRDPGSIGRTTVTSIVHQC